MPKPVYVVSLGILNSIGLDQHTVLQSLKAEKAAIDYPKFLQTHWVNELPVGEVLLGNESLADKACVPDYWPRTALLSACAAREAWRSFADQDRFRVSFLSANTVGGMDRSEAYYPSYLQDHESGSLNDFQYHAAGAAVDLVAAAMGFDGCEQRFRRPALLPQIA
jgi:3-oxoacyl-[acyl-carrier-protein] synthase-1